MGLRGKARLLRTLDERADRLVRGLAFEALSRVSLKTPRDTGRAAGNWNVAEGSPDTRNLPKGNYGVRHASSGANVAGLKAGDVIYITNALPYIPVLEDGHSKQAPAGMIGVTVRELRPLADRIAREIRG